jgi:hypothetical protein
MKCTKNAEGYIGNVSVETGEAEDAVSPEREIPTSSLTGRGGRLAVLRERLAVPTALESAYRLRFLRGEIVRWFGEDAGRLVDELAPAARAASAMAYRREDRVGGSQRAKMKTALRDAYRSLRIDARGLVRRKLLDPQAMKESVDIQGYAALARSVLALVAHFRAAWPEIAAKSSLKIDDLDSAEALARALFEAAAEHDAARESSGANADWERAMLHLLAVNEEVRQMVLVLRWAEGDVDSIIPSIAATRTKRGAYIPPPPRDLARPWQRIRMVPLRNY